MKASKIGYIAGFVDGEGSISVYQGRAITLRASQTDRAPLDFMVQVLGAGHILGPYEPKAGSLGTKPRHVYALSKQEDVLRILRLLLPHLIVKRAKAEQAIALLSSRKLKTDTHKTCDHDRTIEQMKACRHLRRTALRREPDSV